MLQRGTARFVAGRLAAGSGEFSPSEAELLNPPVADFSADDVSITAGGTVTFTDLSTNTPASWSWEKNDGGGWVAFDNEPTAQNPEEEFAEGTWSVRLTATNADGSDDESKADYIEAAAAGGSILTVTNDGGGSPLYETAAAHGLVAEVSVIAIAGVSDPAYDTGGTTAVTTPTPTSFTTGHVSYTGDATGGTWTLVE
jgi:PKD repeat protein